MGRRDYRHRETKKPKKGAKKPTVSEVLATPVSVEVVKKVKKQEGTEEAED
jgi:hypothetical protein